ncbi:MAG: hypothetical protein AAB546_02640 [Patescibacteria group bacterium]
MSILTPIIVFFGALCFLYIFWNKLKEDYTSSIIFSVGFFSLIGMFIFYLLTRFLLLAKIEFADINSSGVLFWLTFVGGMAGYTVGLFKYKLRFFESLEAMGVAMLYLILAVFVADTFVGMSLISLAGSTTIALLLILFYFLESRYRDFTWYRSGRVGFSGLTTVGLFFLIRALVAFPFPFVLSFLGRAEILVSALVTFLLFFAVYNLATKK